VASVFISGNFSVLHPGHIRLFQLAKKLGDVLVIGVNSDNETISSLNVPLELRLESLKTIKLVDQIIVIEKSLEETLSTLKPNIVLKGPEHKNRFNKEESIINEFGGKLVFGSGDFSMSSEEFMANHRNERFEVNDRTNAFLKRHAINPKEIVNLVQTFSQLRVLVIGDLIIDDYIECESIGMSQEDPLVVFRALSKQRFVGGAGIVALHATSLGAKTSLITLAGNDAESNFAAEKFKASGLDFHFVSEGAESTILKQRYRINGKTNFRLNRFDDLVVSNETRAEFLRKALELLPEVDLVIFSDFNYGILDTEMVSSIVSEARAREIFVSADCQISSQIGDYSKYKGVDLVTPTEHEVRVTLRDNSSGLAAIANNFQEQLGAPYLLITLGADGMLLQEKSKVVNSQFLTDSIPAISEKVTDVAGAGDSVLVVASLALAARANLQQAAYLGTTAAALQVNRVGNTPLGINELIQVISK
jgi:rfaE bifunctional protein kinase chain/domain